MLNVSIVLYHPRWQEEVLPLLDELSRTTCLGTIYLIDNSPECATVCLSAYANVQYRHNGGCNLGYGAAHNIALRDTVWQGVDFHLVMNSDICLHASDIDRMHHFMEQNRQVGQLMPHVVYPNGETQYLCKLLPTPVDVFARRFLPQRWIDHRNEQYELRRSGYDRPMNVPYLSGCFMFLRTAAASEAGLFDERFFMYPEDIDLTRRIHRRYTTLYWPEVTIVHNHAKTSYHNGRMLWIHIVNMCRYFNKWGWFFDRERRKVNRKTLSQL